MHYANCPRLTEAARDWQIRLGSRGATPEERLEQFLTISDQDTREEKIRRAAWVAAIYRWRMICMHNETLDTITERMVALKECWRSAIGTSLCSNRTGGPPRR